MPCFLACSDAPANRASLVRQIATFGADWDVSDRPSSRRPHPLAALRLAPKLPTRRPVFAFHVGQNDFDRVRLHTERFAGRLRDGLDEFALLLERASFEQFDMKRRHGISPWLKTLVC